MRLLTYAREGTPRLGVLVRDRVFDVADLESDFPSDMQTFIEAEKDLLPRLSESIEAIGSASRSGATASSTPISEVELLAPIPRPRRNLVCVGLNYAEHASESRITSGIPEHVVLFTKPPSTVIGPGAAVPWHGHVSRRIDWEVELVVVIGSQGRDIAPESALDHVFGYTIGNDITARDLQARHQQWYKGKGLDGFCPLGPWIVTADEFGDPQQKRLQLRVNGDLKQDAVTSDMVFGVADLISAWSQGMTLEPGDLLMTGTPSGVGFARKPPEYLQPGDQVEAEIEGIGVLRHSIGPG